MADPPQASGGSRPTTLTRAWSARMAHMALEHVVDRALTDLAGKRHRRAEAVVWSPSPQVFMPSPATNSPGQISGSFLPSPASPSTSGRPRGA